MSIIPVKSLTDSQLEGLQKDVCEEIRFRAAIAQSTAAVRAIIKYLSAKGFEAKIVADTSFTDRNVFRDAGADLVCRRSPNERFLSGEVKHRSFDFRSRDSFPFDTIIIDRATKGITVDLYFNVSRDLRTCAIVTTDSQPNWNEVKVFDKGKGYHSINFECPKSLARFVSLCP